MQGRLDGEVAWCSELYRCLEVSPVSRHPILHAVDRKRDIGAALDP